jgi:UDP-N-acetylglucosamine acyltransferase
MIETIYNQEFINIDGNWIHKTAIVNDNVQMGKGNRIGAYSVIGSFGEVRGMKPEDFKGKVVIGDNNVISELVTIQTPVDGVTRIGSNNIITAHSHIGHDAQIGDWCEVCISCIGGYAKIEDFAQIKMSSVIRNRHKVGRRAIVGMGSVVTSNIKPETLVYGHPAKENKLNFIQKTIRKWLKL